MKKLMLIAFLYQNIALHRRKLIIKGVIAMNNIKLNGIDEQGNEKEFLISDFKGQKVILYFY